MTIPTFNENEVLYAAQLNTLAAGLAADATSKDNVLKARLDALDRDTGPRSLTISNPTAISGTVIVQRKGSLVTMHGYDLELTGAVSYFQFLSGMAGFQPRPMLGKTAVMPLLRQAAGVVELVGVVEYAGFYQFRIRSTGPGSNISFSGSWITNDAWPSPLPGTPA